MYIITKQFDILSRFALVILSWTGKPQARCHSYESQDGNMTQTPPPGTSPQRLIDELTLRLFEPVLRFSQGERFFPMNVLDYIANSQLKKHIPYRKDEDLTTPWYRAARDLEQGEPLKRPGSAFMQGMEVVSDFIIQSFSSRLKQQSPPLQSIMKEPAPTGQPPAWALAKKLGMDTYCQPDGYYLHFMRDPKKKKFIPTPREGQRIIILLMMMILGLALFFSYLYGFTDFPKMPASQVGLMDFVTTTLKLLLVVVVVILWPVIQINRKIYFALLTVIITSFFIGTPLGSAIEMMLWTVWGAFLAAHLLLKAMDKVSFPPWFTYWKFALPPLAILAILSVLDLWQHDPSNFSFRRSLELFALFLLFSFCWFAIGDITGMIYTWARNKKNPDSAAHPWLEDISYHLLEEQYKPLFVLLAAGLMVAGFIIFLSPNSPLFGAAVRARWIVACGNGCLQNYISIFWVRLGLIAMSAIIWYGLNPIPPWRVPSQNAAGKKEFAWNGPLLGVLGVTILLWSLVNHFFGPSVQMVRFWVFVFLLVIVFMIFGSRLVSALMDALSAQSDIEADYAADKYHTTCGGLDKKDACYYGRVCEVDDWIVLQYNYFYAYNDYRRIADGINNHEGDWEAVAVYLRKDRQPPDYKLDAELKQLCGESDDPCSADIQKTVLHRLEKYRLFGVAYSQHHSGVFAFWDDETTQAHLTSEQHTARCIRQEQASSHHPLIYAALGSHAHYPQPDEYPAPKQFSGATQRIITLIDTLFSQLHTRGSSKDHKADLLFEFATGDGLRIGFDNPPDCEIGDYKYAKNLPSKIVNRKQSIQERTITSKRWKCHVVMPEDELENWIEYRGLWGRYALLADESGPNGPKWNRPGPEVAPTRVRWGPAGRRDALLWKDILLLEMLTQETCPAPDRIRALNSLINDSNFVFADGMK
jgi:hypothetical protein